jgi:galactosamine-6-phosphate isomerase
MRTYQLAAARGAADPKLFARVRLLNLDEWGGLASADSASCEAHLRSALISPLNLAERYIGFDGQAADPEAECRRIRDWLARNGPIDVCVLGLGLNGHLGFNEPAEHLQPHAHVAQLSKASLSHAMVQRRAAPPTYGLTLGMADLLQARRILLLVTGASKRPTMERLLSGRLTTEFPASLLALHRDVRLLCDEAAYPKDQPSALPTFLQGAASDSNALMLLGGKE